MKTIGTQGNRWLMFALLIASIVAMLPRRIVAQDKPDNSAQRIQQLEQENARLRRELEKVEALKAPKPEQLAAEINVARAELDQLRARYTDQHPKVLEAQKRLQKLREYQAVLKDQPPGRTHRNRIARERELYEEELALARKYADTIRKQLEAGRTTLDELVRAQRQMFGIQREIARLEENRAQMRQVLEEEMAAVQRLLNETKRQVEVGRAPPGHDLDLQREMLKLRREMLKLEQP
jgi:hypothetical protein